MKAKWLLEKDTFEENLDGIKDAIKAQGMEYKIVDYVPFEGMKFEGMYADDDCVVVYGSLGMCQQVRRKAKLVPGVYCDLDKFKCTYYYPRLGKYLLNSNYVMLPYGELLRQRAFLFDTIDLVKQGAIFIRPDSGFKTFTGQVVNHKKFAEAVEYLGFYDVTPEALVVVSSIKKIHEEWRLVVVDGQAVSASQYKENGLVKLREGAPDAVYALANEIADTLRPVFDRCFTVDICRTGVDDLSLVEINSFSASGLYVTDKMAVIEAVSKAAVADYEEIHDCHTTN